MVYLGCGLSTAYTICATWMQKELGKTLTKVHNRHPAQTPTEMASDPCNALQRNPVHVAFTVWRTCGEKDPTLHKVKALKDTLSERCSWGLPRIVSSEGRRRNSCCKIQNAFVAKACVWIWCNRRCAFRTTVSSRIIIESQAIYIYLYVCILYYICI